MKKIFVLSFILLTAASCNVFGGSGTLGVLKTLDGGGNWQQADAIQNSKSNIAGLTVAEMGFDPQNRQTLYLAAVNQGFWTSTDSAQSWHQILTNISALDFIVDPTNGKNIYVSGIFNNHGRIVRTTDGGKTWEEEYEEASANNGVNTITANPANPNELYAGLNSGVLIKSVDSGVNWFVVYDFSKAGNGPQQSFQSSNGQQILKARFNPVSKSLYVLTSTNGLAESTDNGVTWKYLTASLTSQTFSDLVSLVPRKVDSFVKMALDDSVPGVVYLTTSGGLYKTSDDGKSWVFLNVPVKSTAQLPRAIASSKGGVLAYASIGSTIFKSLDGGQSWQTEELPTTNSINRILIDPVLPQIVYAGLVPAK